MPELETYVEYGFVSFNYHPWQKHCSHLVSPYFRNNRSLPDPYLAHVLSFYLLAWRSRRVSYAPFLSLFSVSIMDIPLEGPREYAGIQRTRCTIYFGFIFFIPIHEEQR